MFCSYMFAVWCIYTGLTYSTPAVTESFADTDHKLLPMTIALSSTTAIGGAILEEIGQDNQPDVLDESQVLNTGHYC